MSALTKRRGPEASCGLTALAVDKPTSAILSPGPSESVYKGGGSRGLIGRCRFRRTLFALATMWLGNLFCEEAMSV